MSEVVTGVLQFAFGFISNKVRTYAVEELHGGDLTDQALRELIVDELEDINFKIDANARKDLHASVSVLTRGVKDLQMAIDQFVESGGNSTSELPEIGKQSQDTTAGGESSAQAKPAQKSVAIEDALAIAIDIGKLKIISSERFESARKSFEEAEMKACEAFHQEALSTEERILASQVRIASVILEYLHDLEFAANRCLHYLEELHNMKAIQKIFLVHVGGGKKSFFKKDSRLEIVEKVTMINLTLADFISKFTKRRMAVFDWPVIECGKRVVHPIHYETESLPKLKYITQITPPWDMTVLEGKLYNCKCSVLNSKGDLVCIREDGRGLWKLDKTTGKLQPNCLSPVEENTEHLEPRSRDVRALVVDARDTMYVLSGDEKIGYTLSIYSADGINRNHRTLKFLEGVTMNEVAIAVTKDKNIVICHCDRLITCFRVCLCDSNGEVIESFDTGLKHPLVNSVFVSRYNEILLVTKTVSSEEGVLYVYTQHGQLQRTVKLRTSVPNLTYARVSYNPVTEDIIIAGQSYDSSVDVKISIECLSDETGEIRRSYLLHRTNFPLCIAGNIIFFTHAPNGALALLGGGMGAKPSGPFPITLMQCSVGFK